MNIMWVGHHDDGDSIFCCVANTQRIQNKDTK